MASNVAISPLRTLDQILADILRDYLIPKSPIYVELKALQQQGWDSSLADTHFARQRKNADKPDDRLKTYFFKMMQQLAREMQNSTGALKLAQPDPRILDICMAPGGFATQMLTFNPGAQLSGFSLAPDAGGHDLRLNINDERVQVTFTDVTLLGRELGISKDDIPADHPDAARFEFEDMPALEYEFDIVFCDGQVLRTHKRAEYRESKEAMRLTCTQLVIALQHIKRGGTIVMLLHKADSWQSLDLLNTFDQFSKIRLFKSGKFHANRGSFYLIAMDVQPQSSFATQSISQWKSRWKRATFPSIETVEQETENAEDMAAHITSVLERFGKKFISLAEPVWETQKDALARSPFILQRHDMEG